VRKERDIQIIEFYVKIKTPKNRKQESVRGIRFWTFINVHFQNLKDFLRTEKYEKSVSLDNAVNSEKIILK
jgi:hypothetical protein